MPRTTVAEVIVKHGDEEAWDTPAALDLLIDFLDTKVSRHVQAEAVRRLHEVAKGGEVSWQARPAHHLRQQARGEIARATGHRYEIDVDALDRVSLEHLVRLIRNLKAETQAEKNKRRRGLPPYMG